ncbi:hypothetical protein [Flavobacterium urocaniciphilum]|uniref:MetA-pathway of phenol degradation n=1 Tax=Flavobacterium urocaniciphilum TaxID=1299341 RepID=A0A1H8ZQT8_9FLAO|nr:hypothetical protein [Flavobacterium urocaniciphilum]SEP66657.1 hypothetical protein SAMN05444005_101841 [Flavobacterium urocaniciphilum]
MRKILLLFVALNCQNLFSQELFVITDPASNVPANSLAVNVMQSLFKEEMKSGYNYHFMPEVTYGLNKNLMFRASAFVSNRGNELVTEGGGFYTKYRFYSTDDLNSHFRMAAFGRFSFNNADIHQEQIEIMGHNSGFETGLVATKLIKKVAISSTLSFEKALDNTSKNPFPDYIGDNATNYTLSVGKLMYPKKYTNYKQTNINLMMEFVGQTINENGKSYLDVMPAVQFIFNSQARLDLAYRQELVSSMVRSAPNGFYFNLYYTFFDLKKKN